MEVPGAGRHRRIGPYALLGSGRTVGGGELFAARTDEGLLVTVTVAGPEPAANPEFRDRLRAAVEAARSLSGAFLVPVVDADADAPVPWVATRFTAGLPLRHAVDRHGALGEPALRVLADGLARALAVLHGAGTVHGEVDPDSVLLTMDGPRIGALGLVGATASPPPSPTDDMFGLGATVLYAASGGEQDTDALPASLREVIGGCLYPEPSDRPTAEQLVDYLEHQGLPAPEGGWLPPAVTADMAAAAAAVGSARAVQVPVPPRPVRAPGTGVSRRNLIISLAGGAALLGGGAAALAFSGDSAPPPEGRAGGPGTTARPTRPSGARTTSAPSPSGSSAGGPEPVVLAGPDAAKAWSWTGKRAPVCLEASDKVVMVVTDKATSFMEAASGDRAFEALNTRISFGASTSTHPTAYADGVFYLLCDVPGQFDVLAAFDATDGKVKWAAGLAATDPGGAKIVSNYGRQYLAASGGTVYVCGLVRDGKFSVDAPKTGYIRAFAATTGKKLWQVQGTDINNVLVPPSGSRLLAASAIPAKQPGRVQMIDAARKGARGWKVPLRYPSSYFSSGWPLTGYADGNFLFAGGKGDTLSVVDAATGTEKWHQRFEARNGDRVSMGAPFSSLDGATVYVPVGSELVALATADGTPRWIATLDGASDSGGANLFKASLRLGGREAQCLADTVFATDSAKTLWAIDAATGRARWKYSDPSQPDVGFRWTVGGDRVFIASHLTMTAIAADGR
ncbi:PQQ-binding-like beta-propeller repeat protein [Streptomyces sp. CAI-121]|uniref:outer membrane protein assembly factor BamB family protein n=1 Tax=unclassified Streptomyces TaxID=2593676 RepID=UPI0015876A8C|nr:MULTISPECIES: PQQ-binding-like beta-propeller repeat protein [unclassified Streptomyces]NUV65567.1 PQQ-binding-like beta-propeller repeat protein [Streptomyces sp. CAI-121]NUW12304.1 PQQ-binding-like beta-propeller repeat protein [Streptomyces sp. CAI-68]